jgi:hypothetical protein
MVGVAGGGEVTDLEAVRVTVGVGVLGSGVIVIVAVGGSGVRDGGTMTVGIVEVNVGSKGGSVGVMGWITGIHNVGEAVGVRVGVRARAFPSARDNVTPPRMKMIETKAMMIPHKTWRAFFIAPASLPRLQM